MTVINVFNYSKQTNLTELEFIVRIYYGGQRVQVNKKIIVMSWISLLCEKMHENH
jgi:hypothetical protein